MKKRVLSLLLTLSMVLALLPTASVPALAAGDVTGDGYAYTESSKTLTINTTAGMTSWGNDTSIKKVEVVNVHIGDSVAESSINVIFNDYSSLDDCASLMAFTVGLGNTAYKAVAGVLFSYDGKKLLRYPQAKADVTAYDVPTGVTDVESLAFSNCSVLQDLTFQEGVTTIGDNAFNMSTALESVSLPASLTKLNSLFFSGCKALLTITVAESNTVYQSVDGVLFNKAGTTLLKYPDGKADPAYTIPATTTTIGGYAFRYNQNLTKVILPSTVTTVDLWAFSNCKKLETVTLSTELTTISYGTFYKCAALKKITIPSKVATINGLNFFQCPSLKTVIMKPLAAPTLDADQFKDDILQVVYYPKNGATGYNAGNWTQQKVKDRLVPGAAALADLSVSVGVGTLTPAFTPANETYTVAVADNVDTLKLTPTNGNVETITVHGATVRSGVASQPITLVNGDNVIPIVATDTTSGDKKTYTVTVIKGTGSSTKAWNGKYSDMAHHDVGFNYGDAGHLRVTMPVTEDYYTYGTIENNVVAQTASNKATLPASGWNWNVKCTSYSGATYTLTLKDAVWTNSFAGGDALMANHWLNLIQEGVNSITCTAADTLTVSTGPSNDGSDNYYTLDMGGAGTLTATAKGAVFGGTAGAAIHSGVVLGKSDGQVLKAGRPPDCAKYVHCALSFSTDINGTKPTVYEPSKNDSYKYFKVAPGAEHTITLDYQSGITPLPTVTTRYCGNVETLPTPARAGYIFDGWYSAATNGDKVNTYTFFAGPTTIYAHWTALPTYTITFDFQEGTGSPATAQTTYQFNLATLPTPSRAGYNFTGWFTEINGGGTKVTTNTVFQGPTTIYAHWAAAPIDARYLITTDSKGGTGAPPDALTQSNGKLAVLPTAPTKDGFTFDGWFTAATGGTQITTNTVFQGPTTIYAQWTAIPPVPPVPPADGGYVPPKKPVIVDGKTVNIGTEKKSGSTTTLAPDQKRLTDEIGKAKEDGTVVVPVSKSTTAVARLVVKNVEDMAAKSMTLSVETGGVRYDLPTNAMDVKAMAHAFPGVDTAKIPFDVTIGSSGVTVQDAAVVLKPTEFTITATSGDKTVSTDRFSVFVDRTFEITKAQSEKITTAVVVEPDGTLRHVPTFVYQKNGKYYAVVKSMTNSVYTLIQNEITFPDAKGKWYEDVADEVGSRKIVVGTDKGTFDGDEKITRAEFAAMIVRGLGLPLGKTGVFTDVPSDAWYAGSVATATEYGIVKGVGEQKFNPNGLITREEAFQMLYTAGKRTGLPKPLDPRNLSEELSDLTSVSDWAQTAVSWCLNQNLTVNLDGAIHPTEEITRGEMSALILKLLQRSQLVDVRTKL